MDILFIVCPIDKVTLQLVKPIVLIQSVCYLSWNGPITLETFCNFGQFYEYIPVCVCRIMKMLIVVQSTVCM